MRSITYAGTACFSSLVPRYRCVFVSAALATHGLRLLLERVGMDGTVEARVTDCRDHMESCVADRFFRGSTYYVCIVTAGVRAVVKRWELLSASPVASWFVSDHSTSGRTEDSSSIHAAEGLFGF